MTLEAEEKLRKLIRRRDVKRLAKDADVSYHKLIRWYSRKTRFLSMAEGERVYFILTGLPLIP